VAREAFITLWREEAGFTNLLNGFSFVAHLFPDADHWLVDHCNSDERLQALVKQRYDKIYFSFSFSSQYQKISPYLNDRWVIGGPAASVLHRFHVDTPAEIVLGSFEEYLGIETSCRFTDYWRDHLDQLPAKKLVYNCSVGNRCYWNKCTFCDSGLYGSDDCERRAIGSVLAQLRPISIGTSTVRLSTDSMTPKQFEEVMRSPIRRKIPLSFMFRADPAFTRVLKTTKHDTRGLYVSMGVEVLSQAGMDILNKGIDINDVFEITRLFIEKGGKVKWFLMNRHPFMTKAMADDCIANIQRMKKEFGKFPKYKLMIKNVGPTYWPTEATAQTFGKYRHVKQNMWEAYLNLPSEAVLDQDRRINCALRDSGIVQLYPEWYDTITRTKKPRKDIEPLF